MSIGENQANIIALEVQKSLEALNSKKPLDDIQAKLLKIMASSILESHVRRRFSPSSGSRYISLSYIQSSSSERCSRRV